MTWRTPRPGTLRFVALIAALALPVRADPPACFVADIGRVVVTADGLQVNEAVTRELQTEDILVQLNSRILRGCTDLIEALSEARERQLALLFLVRRGDDMQAVVLRPATAVVAAAASSATPPPVPTPTAVTIGVAAAAPVRDALARLQVFGHTLQANLPLLTAQPWVRQINDLRQSYERRQANLSALRAVDPILAHYQAVAEILLYKEATARAAQGPRPQPNAAFDYNTGSQVTVWLRRYPFLQASVIEPPEQTTYIGWAESNGRWSPDRAIELLIERALADGDALGRQLDTANDR